MEYTFLEKGVFYRPCKNKLCGTLTKDYHMALSEADRYGFNEILEYDKDMNLLRVLDTNTELSLYD